MEITLTVLIAIIVGVVQTFKYIGLPSTYAPLVSLALGAFFVSYLDGLSAQNVIMGLIVGLSASGLYSGGKTLLK